MIIGIDESGSFDDNEISVFVSVYIRVANLENVQRKFEEWEKSLPNSAKLNGEVKGNLLSQEQLEDFALNIISKQVIFYSCYGIKLDAETLTGLREQKRLILKGVEEGVGFYKSRGKKFIESAKGYSEYLKWNKKLKIINLAKVDLLGYTIVNSLKHAVIMSVLAKIDKELGDLEFRVDKDYVTEDRYFWGETFRNQLYAFTVENPIPELKEWGENHPYKKRFQKNPKSRGNKIELTKAFKECIKFLDSKDDFVIRIADIVATISRRNANRATKDKSYQLIREFKVPQIGSVQLLVLKKRKRRIKKPYNYTRVYIYRITIFLKRLLRVKDRN